MSVTSKCLIILRAKEFKLLTAPTLHEALDIWWKKTQDTVNMSVQKDILTEGMKWQVDMRVTLKNNWLEQTDLWTWWKVAQKMRHLLGGKAGNKDPLKVISHCPVQKMNLICRGMHDN